ncbi:hypothetical protein ACHAW5_005108 [Stephanodiscus triporus]|uniref:Pentacotripeptide-repeat region of PRORP domain-containing protein n=1 Tax=Stephanodiscus triporus TaxID=2934178 RepID=A0ABD3MMB6_9STRA
MPTTETYNNVMSCWGKSGAGCGAYDDYLAPSSSSSTRSPSSTSRWPYMYHPNPCSNLLRRMLTLYRADPIGMARMKPDYLSFNGAISSLSRDQMYRGGGGGVGRACYDHLMSMLELYDGGSDARCAPDLITFSTVLNVLGRGSRRDGEDGGGGGGGGGGGEDVDGDESRAREVLDVMLYLGGVDDGGRRGVGSSGGGKRRDGDDDAAVDDARGRRPDFEFDVRPRNKHFNVVLALMANKRRVDDATLECARRYVDIMELLRRDEEDTNASGRSRRYMPRNHSDSSIFEGDGGGYFEMPPVDHRRGDHSTSFDDEGERASHYGTMRSAPDIVTYNTLLNIAARAGRPEKAEEILNGMIKNSSDGTSEVRPDSISFNTVLLAWSKAKSHTGRLKTEQILDEMQKMAKDGDTNVRPDRTSMTTVINAIISTVHRNRMAPFQAERIIELMENNRDHALRPDVVTYTSLIKCWAESGRSRAADRAEEIINTLHQRYDMGYAECKPDTMLYNVAMNALAKSDAPNAPERAEALLNRMLNCYYAGDVDLAPTTQSFSTAIQAWARSNDRKGAMKAELLLQTMHDLEDARVGNVSPNTICYSTCILAWKNSGEPDAGKRADVLLKKMEMFDSKGLYDLKPNVVSFTLTMEAWINSRHPDLLEKVEAILERMFDRSREGDPDSEPTTTTLNVVLKAIRYSSHAMKHKKAEDILTRMKWMQENGIGRVKPNIYTYNAFFSACAMTEGNNEDKINAFALVLNALIDLQDSKHLTADKYTWPAVWKACENLLDAKRDIEWINRVFDLTIRSGLVNELLFNNMRRFLPAQYLQKKLQKKLKKNVDLQQLTVHHLPPEWTCNVKLGRDPR